jgi:hypothetical protein
LGGLEEAVAGDAPSWRRRERPGDLQQEGTGAHRIAALREAVEAFDAHRTEDMLDNKGALPDAVYTEGWRCSSVRERRAPRSSYHSGTDGVASLGGTRRCGKRQGADRNGRTA